MAVTSFFGPYRWLSNFWYADIVVDGFTYKTVEHAFQCAKTLIPQEQAWIASALSPGEAKQRGGKVTLREDWDDIKVRIMKELLRQKFARHPGLGKRLVDTYPEQLMEGNNWGDRFWGVDSQTLEGENWMGRLLMDVRQELMEARHAEQDRDRR
jgi:ribA/ribD-fused uncharacterized protein